MATFVDEYERQLDERGRIILPAKIRSLLGNTVYITRAPFDRCLHLYTEEEWSNVSDKVSQLPTATDRNAAAFVRLFYGKATSEQVDKQGRISIGEKLMEYASLTKEVVLIGANTRLEIWDSETWKKYQEELSDDIMMEGILKYGLNI